MPKTLLLLSFFALILLGCEKEKQPPNYETDTITDSRDGNTYKIVKIGEQWWMAENLAYLPSVSPSSEESFTEAYYYVYDYQGTSTDEAKTTINYTTYGVLYNWPAAMDACPTGWHLPSDVEWTQLTDYLGGESVAGDKLKEPGTVHWNSPNTGATNETGFTAIPGGYHATIGIPIGIGVSGHWWSSTERSTSDAWHRYMGCYNSNVSRSNGSMLIGVSVRCVRD